MSDTEEPIAERINKAAQALLKVLRVYGAFDFGIPITVNTTDPETGVDYLIEVKKAK